MSRRTAPAEPDAGAPPASSTLRAALERAVPVAVLLVPIGAWLARWQGWPQVGDALALVVVVAVTTGVVRTLGATMAMRLAAMVVVVVAALLHAGVPAAFLPPIAINLAFSFVFAATLRDGEPLIERFARRGGASITPRTARYCRNLTAAWAAWLALLAATGVGIALSHDERVGASWALVNYALVGGFFAAEFAWRRHRSPDAGGWWAHVRNARGGWRTPRG
jgi:uncharacterized membrane protein